MTATTDPDACTARWCEEAADHDSPHRRRLFDVFGLDVDTARPVIVQLWLQGESARTTALVLVTDTRETGLTWPQAKRLSGVLARITQQQRG